MNRLFSAITIAAGLLSASAAHAGWTSGGGELVRDARNPWFIQNTKSVNYCIEIDEANFGLGRKQVETAVRKAIENWKLDFTDTIPSHAGSLSKEIRIATQEFSQVPCSESVPLRFQFGVLSGEQFAKLGDPTKFLGITVRTDYDKKNMRGKGFIYISPSYGPLKFDSKDLIENPWGLEDGSLLYTVVFHELGHLFGLSHTTEFGLMHERLPEILVNKHNAPANAHLLKDLPQFNMFKFSDRNILWARQGVCGGVMTEGEIQPAPGQPKPAPTPKPKPQPTIAWPDHIKKFYGIPDDVKCIRFSLKNEVLSVEAERINESKYELGKAAVTRHDLLSGVESTLSIYFHDEQTVFPGVKGLEPGPRMQSETLFKGVYRTNDGKVSREIGIRARPLGFDNITGTMDGKLLLDVHEGI